MFYIFIVKVYIWQEVFLIQTVFRKDRSVLKFAELRELRMTKLFTLEEQSQFGEKQHQVRQH